MMCPLLDEDAWPARSSLASHQPRRAAAGPERGDAASARAAAQSPPPPPARLA